MSVVTTWDTISFDCYGTLVDWESGITGAFRGAARQDGVDLEPASVVGAYHDVEPELQVGSYRSYRSVLGEAAVRVASRLGWSLKRERAGFLAASLPDWPVFEDTRPALERLKVRYRLAILSNIDDDLLRRTLERVGVEFDWVVTAEQVGSYKPAPAHFREALRRVGGDRDRLLHVAQSYFHDVRPATELRIANIWVNRKGEAEPDGPRPLCVVSNLLEVADWLNA